MNVRRSLTGVVVVVAAATAIATAVVVQEAHQDIHQDMVRPSGQTVIQDQGEGTTVHQDM